MEKFPIVFHFKHIAFTGPVSNHIHPDNLGTPTRLSETEPQEQAGTGKFQYGHSSFQSCFLFEDDRQIRE